MKKSKICYLVLPTLTIFTLSIAQAGLPLESCSDLGGDPSAIIPGEQFTAFQDTNFSAKISLAQNTSFDTNVAVGAGEPSVETTVYHIAPNGSNDSDGSATSPWSLSKANNSLQAGDTALLLEGTYDGAIEPKNSGIQGKPITYKAAPEAKVHVHGIDKQPAVKLRKAYIIIEGFTVSFKDGVWGSGYPRATNIDVRSDHVTVRNMKILSHGDYICQGRQGAETGITAAGSYGLYENNFIDRMKFGIGLGTNRVGAKFNVIRGNTISDSFWDGIHIGRSFGLPLGHLIEKNVISGTLGSDGITFNSAIDQGFINSVIIRNNAIFASAENNIDLKGTTNIVIEGNYLWGALGDNDGSNVIFRDNGKTSLNHGKGQSSINKGAGAVSKSVIIRNNVIMDNGSGTATIDKWKIYNNTILNNRRTAADGSNILPTVSGGSDRHPEPNGLSHLSGTGPNGAMLNNIIGNNGYEVVFHQSGSARIDGNAYYSTFQTAQFATMIAAKNWITYNFDDWKAWLQTKPNFTGNDEHSQLVDYSLFKNVPEEPTGDPALLDFTPKDGGGSTVVDAGVFLTSTVGSGSGKTMVVKDAGVFMDGFGITAGDVIQLDGQTQTAKVVGINGNKLTLNQELTWASGVGIGLAYKGSRPDAGAVEFVASNDDGNVGGGIENNTDEDGDGILNADDAFPTDPNESVDTDNDGVGNNTDTDDDGDGFSDKVEIAAGTDPLDPSSRPSSSPSSLVAHYSFDNISGVTVSDQSGNGNDAIRSGTKIVPGKIGNGLQFDGKSDYVVSGAFDVVGSEITLSAWVKANGFGIHDARIISKATGTEEQDHYWMLSTMESNGSKLRFRLKTNGQTTTLIGIAKTE